MLKQPTLNMTKFASLKKIHTKDIIVKRDIELNDLGFLCYLRRSKELFNIKLKLILR